MEFGVIAIIAAIVAFTACLYEVNVWHRKRRRAMTPKERLAEDDDILNMW
jgi:hypothetical protein